MLTKVSEELKCPTCQALLYSRRTRLCGQCGTPVPDDIYLDDAEAKARDNDRAWAKKIAGAFDPHQTPASHNVTIHGKPTSEADLLQIEALLSEKRDYSLEFKNRKRKWFWVPGAGLCLFVIPIILLVSKTGKSMTTALVASMIVIAVTVLRAWHHASPICPHCHKNIRYCPPGHCHLCGDPLKDNACSPCGVDYSWSRLLRLTVKGSQSWIAHCPGCGVYLDTHIKRWEAGNNTG